MSVKDRTGELIGWLKVLGCVEKPEHEVSTQATYWLCECRCGKQIVVKTKMLCSGNMASCGCRAPGCRYTPEEAAAREAFGYDKDRAKSYGREFTLTFEEWSGFTLSQPCFYCSKPPRLFLGGVRKHPIYLSGLDRIDNSLGYLTTNVVPCCIECNQSKMDEPLQEFLDRIFRIADKFSYLGSSNAKTN